MLRVKQQGFPEYCGVFPRQLAMIRTEEEDMHLYKWGYSGPSQGRDCRHWDEVQVREEVVVDPEEATGDTVGADTGMKAEIEADESDTGVGIVAAGYSLVETEPDRHAGGEKG